MAAMSNYLENKLIDHIFRGTAYTASANVYVALCTAAPTDSSTGSTLAEVSGGNYSRKSIATSASEWKSTQGDSSAASSGSTGTTSNTNIINWASVTWTATITHVAICDATTAGNVLFYGALTASKSVSSGDTFQYTASSLQIQIDN